MSKDATATAAVAVKKKRKRTEDKWANFVSIPSLPKPDPISDNEMTEDDEAMNTEGVARIQVSKIRRELEKRTRNGEREKRRIAAADLKAKNVDIKLTRDDARRDILDAIYEEDIHILNEAMDKGRRLGLEGKTDEGQQWCAHEMRRGYRQIELLQKRAEKQAEARRREIAAEEKLRETRRKKIRQYLELHGKLQDHLVRSEPLGFDANFNIYYLFAGDTKNVYCLVRDEDDSDNCGKWKIFPSDQIYNLYASLDGRGKREKRLRTQLERRFLEIIDQALQICKMA